MAGFLAGLSLVGDVPAFAGATNEGKSKSVKSQPDYASGLNSGSKTPVAGLHGPSFALPPHEKLSLVVAGTCVTALILALSCSVAGKTPATAKLIETAEDMRHVDDDGYSEPNAGILVLADGECEKVSSNTRTNVGLNEPDEGKRNKTGGAFPGTPEGISGVPEDTRKKLSSRFDELIKHHQRTEVAAFTNCSIGTLMGYALNEITTWFDNMKSYYAPRGLGASGLTVVPWNENFFLLQRARRATLLIWGGHNLPGDADPESSSHTFDLGEWTTFSAFADPHWVVTPSMSMRELLTKCVCNDQVFYDDEDQGGRFADCLGDLWDAVNCLLRGFTAGETL